MPIVHLHWFPPRGGPPPHIIAPPVSTTRGVIGRKWAVNTPRSERGGGCRRMGGTEERGQEDNGGGGEGCTRPISPHGGHPDIIVPTSPMYVSFDFSSVCLRHSPPWGEGCPPPYSRPTPLPPPPPVARGLPGRGAGGPDPP